VEGKIADGWGVLGIVTLQSGQAYSAIDYSGAVGSIYYSINDGITNPIVPLAPGCTPQNAVTGALGNNFNFPALKASCFTVPQLLPCNQPNAAQVNGSFPCSAIPPGDTFETNFLASGGQRNIFRQAWQKRADLSVVKVTQITERVTLKYRFDVYNLTNHPSLTFRSTILTKIWLLAHSRWPSRRTEPAPHQLWPQVALQPPRPTVSIFAPQASGRS
jgi:hypothetical protein